MQTFKGELHKDRFERVLQQGTFNANPLSAAAGLDGAADRRRGLGDRAVRADRASSCALACAIRSNGAAWPGAVLGEISVFQILLGEGMEEAVDTTDVQRLMAGRGAVNTLRKAMLLNGVDLMRSGGFTSIAHGDAGLTTPSARSITLWKRCNARDWPEGLNATRIGLNAIRI